MKSRLAMCFNAVVWLVFFWIFAHQGQHHINHHAYGKTFTDGAFVLFSLLNLSFAVRDLEKK